MYWDVKTVKTEGPLTLFVTFCDGTSGNVKFRDRFLTGVFASLRDPEFFEKVFVKEGAVMWPYDLDLAPDAMYHEIKSRGEWILE